MKLHKTNADSSRDAPARRMLSLNAQRCKLSCYYAVANQWCKSFFHTNVELLRLVVSSAENRDVQTHYLRAIASANGHLQR
jgi:hypothetical protein